MRKRLPRKKNQRVNPPSSALPHFLIRGLREGGFIFLLAFALFLLLALSRYNLHSPLLDSPSNQKAVIYSTGQVGVYLASFLYHFLGYLAFLLPVSCIYFAWFVLRLSPTANTSTFIRSIHLPTVSLRSAGFGLMLLGSCGLVQLLSDPSALNTMQAYTSSMGHPRGGLIGYFVVQNIKYALSISGACLLLAAATLIGTTLFTGLSWIKVTEVIGRYTLLTLYNALRTVRILILTCLKILKHFSYKGLKLISLFTYFNVFFRQIPKTAQRSFNVIRNLLKRSVQRFKFKRPKHSSPPLHPVKPLRFDTLKARKKEPTHEQVPSAMPTSAPNTPSANSPMPAMNLSDNRSTSTGSTTPPASASPKKKPVNKTTNSLLPPLSLLDPGEPNKLKGGYTYQDLEKLSREVEQHLLDFGIQADVVAVHPGPVITRFELQLAAGVKVSKLSSLAKDLARSLSVISVRVVEVIPGKTVVGLELPNHQRDMVRLSEVLSADVYQQAASPLILALGVDIAGHPIVVDLAKMPHLLVAGTTGSGKSVGINAMILSLLFRLSPEEVRLIMVDPKMLELSIYDRIPHLLTPVVTDMREAASALRWCVEEMERRYRLMAAFGVRNLLGFNLKVKEALAKGEPLIDPCWKALHTLEEKPPALEPLPYIVVIIDELADMMMVVGKKVEQLIARIAQKARAAGIHLILATQRPSVDVLTGLIKSNIPTRISFQVSSKIDSRTILDQQGADQLLGHGDMLYLTPGSGAPFRIHGAFVDDKEVHRVTDAWRERGEPNYINEITESLESSENPDGDAEGFEEADPLYDQAVAFVIQTRKASISSVQRRLKVGYNRAARLVETMENKGIVGPLSGGSRDVLVPEFSED